MRFDNTNTDTGYPYFIPDNGEVQAHISTEWRRVPSVSVLPGDQSMLFGSYEGQPFISDADASLSTENEVPGGVRLTGLFTGEQSLPLAPRPWEQNRARRGISYLFRRDDRLLVDARPVDTRPASLAAGVQRTDMRIVPATESLPEGDRQAATGGLRHIVKGLIDSEGALATWRSAQIGDAQRVVDLAVVMHEVRNPTEAHILTQAMAVRPNRTLLGMVADNRVAQMYLTDYDQQHGTTFVPTEEPQALLDREFSRYSVNESLLRGLKAAATQYRPDRPQS